MSQVYCALLQTIFTASWFFNNHGKTPQTFLLLRVSDVAFCVFPTSFTSISIKFI